GRRALGRETERQRELVVLDLEVDVKHRAADGVERGLLGHEERAAVAGALDLLDEVVSRRLAGAVPRGREGAQQFAGSAAHITRRRRRVVHAALLELLGGERGPAAI